MKTILKAVAAGVTGLMILGAASASASHKPDYCSYDHDHRSHDANYYDYYAHDRYYRAGPYRDSGVSFSIRVGDRDYYDGRRYRRDYDRGRYNGYRGRVVNREVFPTRYRARIILTEEIRRGRRGHPRLVCTVRARGPEAHYVSERRMYRIANRNCSHRARIRVLA